MQYTLQLNGKKNNNILKYHCVTQTLSSTFVHGCQKVEHDLDKVVNVVVMLPIPVSTSSTVVKYLWPRVSCKKEKDVLWNNVKTFTERIEKQC